MEQDRFIHTIRNCKYRYLQHYEPMLKLNHYKKIFLSLCQSLSVFLFISCTTNNFPDAPLNPQAEQSQRWKYRVSTSNQQRNYPRIPNGQQTNKQPVLQNGVNVANANVTNNVPVDNNYIISKQTELLNKLTNIVDKISKNNHPNGKYNPQIANNQIRQILPQKNIIRFPNTPNSDPNQDIPLFNNGNNHKGVTRTLNVGLQAPQQFNTNIINKYNALKRLSEVNKRNKQDRTFNYDSNNNLFSGDDLEYNKSSDKVNVSSEGSGGLTLKRKLRGVVTQDNSMNLSLNSSLSNNDNEFINIPKPSQTSSIENIRYNSNEFNAGKYSNNKTNKVLDTSFNANNNESFFTRKDPDNTNYVVQLATMRYRDDLANYWTQLTSIYQKISKYTPFVMEVNDDSGTYYHLRAGPLGNHYEANQICSELNEAQINCIVSTLKKG